MGESANPQVGEMRFKVRPFERTFDAPRSGTVKSTGVIAGNYFVLSFDFHDYQIPMARSGHDEFGVYAEILEQEIKNADGSVLTVSGEADEFLGEVEIGCQISIAWPSLRTIEMRKRVDDQLAKQGTWPADVNAIYPIADDSFRVYFGSSGYVDGSGTSFSEAPTTRVRKETGH